jgi:hypothetical protein
MSRSYRGTGSASFHPALLLGILVYGYATGVFAFFTLHLGSRAEHDAVVAAGTHIGGEKVFVDFAGDTIDIFDPITGEVRAMKLFVAAMGASNYLRRGLPKREPVRRDRRACQPVPVSSRCAEVRRL